MQGPFETPTGDRYGQLEKNLDTVGLEKIKRLFIPQQGLESVKLRVGDLSFQVSDLLGCLHSV
jgi:hypothetical protein